MEQDQLSSLPKIILHDILSRLPEEDAVRTSVLSKTWAHTWYTFPILSFSDTKIVGRRVHDLLKSSNIATIFLNNVRRALLRFHTQGLTIKTFKLSMRSFDLYYVSKYIYHWLKFVIENGAEELELDRSLCLCQQHYVLPKSILKAKSLSKLVLKGIKVDLSLVNHSMNIFSLQVLKLELVLLEDEHALNHFISRCPLIEDIMISGCECLDDKGHLHDLESVNMCGLQKLKRVYVYQVQEVYVDSPCLEYFHYCPCNEPPEKMFFGKCKNLRELHLRYLQSTIITNNCFYEFFANLPFLENLKLTGCPMSRRILISSVQLKVLELSSCPGLKEVNIDAPNLLSCEYHDRRRAIKSITFLRCSSQLKVYVWIDSYSVDFSNLREFIQNFTPKIALASVSLSIQESMDALNPLLIQVSSLPPNIAKVYQKMKQCICPLSMNYFQVVALQLYLFILAVTVLPKAATKHLLSFSRRR